MATTATVTLELKVNNPSEEVVILTADDGHTYDSRKFGVVRAAQATLYEDTAALSIPVSLAISRATVTIHCTGLSGQLVCLTLYGSK